MPIPGIRKQPEHFPLIGSIRKGAKKTTNAPGKDLGHFRYVPIEGEEEAAAKFFEIYKNEPREIAVFLPFCDIEHNLEMFMERYTASALQCRGDIEGGTAFMWRDKGGNMQHQKKDCPALVCDGCKETGRLSVIIPALERYARVVVHTTSTWDILELFGNLRAIKKSEGKLQGVPLILKRRPRTISTPRPGGKRARQEMWLLSIEVAPRYVQERLERLQRGDAPKALPPGAQESQGPDWGIVEDDAPLLFAEEEIEGVYQDNDASISAAVIAAGFTKNKFSFDVTMKKLGLPADAPQGVVMVEFKAYRAARDRGLDSDAATAQVKLNRAMAYKTDSGKVLGKLSPDDLAAMVEKIDAFEKEPGPQTKAIKEHCLILLEYHQQFEIPS